MAKKSPLFIDIAPGLSMRIGLPVILSWDSTKRPKRVRRGTIGFNTQTSSLEYWDGTDWFTASMRKD